MSNNKQSKQKMTAAEYMAHVNRQLALVGAKPVTVEGIAQRYGSKAAAVVAKAVTA